MDRIHFVAVLIAPTSLAMRFVLEGSPVLRRLQIPLAGSHPLRGRGAGSPRLVEDRTIKLTLPRGRRGSTLSIQALSEGKTLAASTVRAH